MRATLEKHRTNSGLGWFEQKYVARFIFYTTYSLSSQNSFHRHPIISVDGIIPYTLSGFRHPALSSSPPPFHLSVISQFARSDPISHISLPVSSHSLPPSFCAAISQPVSSLLLIIQSRRGSLSLTHFLFLLAFLLLCLFISSLHQKGRTSTKEHGAIHVCSI